MDSHMHGKLDTDTQLLKQDSVMVQSHGYVSSRRRFFDRYWNSWWPETAALSLGIACAAATAVVLGCYDGAPSPKLSWGITLNAIISILGTTSKVALIYAVSNSLGQLKWLWLGSGRTRALIDAEHFDDASRGPLGAMTLLWSRTRKSFASVGAVIIIVALTFDPFIQQVITYETREHFTQSSDASIQTAIHLNYKASETYGTRAIASAFVRDDFELEPTCKSSNCKWPPFQSLAWCGECSEEPPWTLSDQCNFRWTPDDFNTSYNTSNDVMIRNCTATRSDGQAVRANVTIALWTFSSGADKNYNIYRVDVPVLQIYTLGNGVKYGQSGTQPFNGAMHEIGMVKFNLESDLSFSISAKSCKLDLCVKSYGLSTVNGTVVASTTDQLLKKRAEMNYTVDPLKGSLGPRLCYELPDTSTTNSTNDYKVGISNSISAINGGDTEICVELGGEVHDGLYKQLRQVRGNITQDLDCRIHKNNTELKSSSDLLRICPLNETSPRSRRTLGPYTEVWMEHGPDQIIKNLANSLTKLQLDPNININGTRPIYGEIGEQVTYLKVRWQWLAVPYALSIAGVMFLLITIYESRQVNAPLWKSSINAFIYHGIGNGNAEVDSRLHTIPEMDKRAKATRVRLTPSGQYQRLLIER